MKHFSIKLVIFNTMKFRVLAYLVGLLFGSMQVLAQEEFVQSPAIQLSQFRFTQMSGGIILVKAKLDDHLDSLNFVLDTGSGGISLDSATAALLKLIL